MRTATVKWVGGEQFLATMPSGKAITFDAGSTHEGGPGPMEVLLGALGACTSVDASELSQTKYCSVAAMLGKTAKITWRYEIVK